MKSQDIYILAAYPNAENIKDGMFQRIKTIDTLLAYHTKIYINLSITNPFFKIIIHNDNTKELFLNPFNPYYIIKEFLLKAKTIYIHSIHPLKFIPYGLFYLKNKKNNLILDAHGIVPEEIFYYGKRYRSFYMNWIERNYFNTLSHCICVSNAMINHFKYKYPDKSISYHLLTTSNLLPIPMEDEIRKLRFELKINDKNKVIIYSGNCQLWQNIPLIMKNIQSIISEFKIIILTGEKKIFEDYFKEYHIDLTKVILRSVAPSELNKYYSISNYGYLLRDDILLNRVSNPTKMLEYLQFGIVPVVLSPQIGDYIDKGYEYLRLADFESKKTIAIKSIKNIEIANGIVKLNENFNIENILN